jgi:hypothetical protein
MGADLYIRSVFDPHRDEWHPRFKAAVAARDALPKGTPEYEGAQRRVVECLARIFERGYFRDPYNPRSVLWQFGLSWWQDVTPLLDGDGLLSPENARVLLRMLEGREDTFRENLCREARTTRRYFRREYAMLQAFLRESIHRDEAVLCSL